MSALKVEHGESRVRAEDAVEIVDCGRASERTKGGILLVFLESGSPPFNWFLF
jgi:hypothetical protein